MHTHAPSLQNIFTVYVARLGRVASYSPWPAALAGLSAALTLAGLSRAWGVYPVPFAALLPTAVSVPVRSSAPVTCQQPTLRPGPLLGTRRALN